MVLRTRTWFCSTVFSMDIILCPCPGSYSVAVPGGLLCLRAFFAVLMSCLGARDLAGLCLCVMVIFWFYMCSLSPGFFCFRYLAVFTVQIDCNFDAPGLLSSSSPPKVTYGSLIYYVPVPVTISHGFGALFSWGYRVQSHRSPCQLVGEYCAFLSLHISSSLLSGLNLCSNLTLVCMQVDRVTSC